MTDKQIIIDVCPYQGECSVSGCKRNDDGCFVRQLFEERYRAENQIVELNKTIKAKEQECEGLKRQHESDKGLITSTGKMNYQLLQEYVKYKAESDLLRQTHKTEQDRRRAYENALTEIKELCQKHIKAEKIVMANDILQKISEVEE